MASLPIRSVALIGILCICLAGLPQLDNPPAAVAAPVRAAPAGPIRPMGRDCGGTVLLATNGGIPGPFEPRLIAPAASAVSSGIWDSDSEFLTGFFDQTDVVSGSGRATLMQRWTPNLKANNDQGVANQDQPSLAVDAEDNVYAAWRDDRNGNPDIFVARLRTDSLSWSNAFKVNNDSAIAVQSSPSLAAGAKGALYVAWEDMRNGNADIYAASSTTGGASWGANIKVHAETASPTAQSNPNLIRSASGALFVAWEDRRSGNADIYVARSTDGGAAWSAAVRANTVTAGDQLNPVLAIDAAGALYAAWEDHRSSDADIYVARSTDDGLTWSAGVQANDNTDVSDQLRPSLAAAPNGMLLAGWQGHQRGMPSAYVARSTDGGLTWSRSVLLSSSAGLSASPGLAIDRDGKPYCFWCEYLNGIDTIYVARSTDDGATWNAPVRVNDDAGLASRGDPSMVIDGAGGLYSAWKDDRDGSSDILTSYWPDTSQVYTDGIYIADVLDAGASARWQSLEWQATLPQGAAITVAVRFGNSATPNSTWTAWYTHTNSPADLSSLPPSRYAQWRAHLTAPGATTPGLEAVALTWQRRLYLAVIQR